MSFWQGSFAVDLPLKDAETRRNIRTGRFVRKLFPDNIYVLRAEVATSVAQRLAQPYGVIFSQTLADVGQAPQTLALYHAVVEFYL